MLFVIKAILSVHVVDKLERTPEAKEKTNSEQALVENADEEESDEDDPDNDPHYEVENEVEGDDDDDSDDES